MAWVVVGLKRATERVEGGAQLVRLYFIDVFDLSRDRVMACGACGAAFVTDELAAKARRDP